MTWGNRLLHEYDDHYSDVAVLPARSMIDDG